MTLEPDKINPVAAQKIPWYLTRAAAVWGLLLVGPFALPLLWFSRGFKKNAKIIITLVVVALTYVSYVYTPVLLDKLEKQLQEYQAATKS